MPYILYTNSCQQIIDVQESGVSHAFLEFEIFLVFKMQSRFEELPCLKLPSLCSKAFMCGYGSNFFRPAALHIAFEF